MAARYPDGLGAALLAVVLLALVASGIAPHERGTWVMEVAPVLIVIPILIATRRSFPLSDLLYVLIALHALVLILGGAGAGAGRRRIPRHPGRSVGYAMGHVHGTHRRGGGPHLARAAAGLAHRGTASRKRLDFAARGDGGGTSAIMEA